MRMIRLIVLLVLLSPLAWANQSAQGFCTVGNQAVIVSGITSTSKVQISYPQCTATVYLHGTVTLATIYSDNNAAPTPLANPFTASNNGVWQWYANNGHYDVVLSGAGFASPFTISDIALGDPAMFGGAIAYVQQYAGADLGAQINAAEAALVALSGASGEIVVSSQSAFTACTTDVTVTHSVVFKGGVFTWNCTLNGTSGISIVGPSSSYVTSQSTILKRTSGTKTMISFVGVVSPGQHVQNFRISDIGLEGGGTAGKCVLIQNADSFKILNTSCRNGGAASALDMEGDAWDFWVQNSAFSLWGDATHESVRLAAAGVLNGVITDGHFLMNQIGEVGNGNPLLTCDASSLELQFIGNKFHYTGTGMPYMVNCGAYRSDWIGNNFQGISAAAAYQLKLTNAMNKVIGNQFLPGGGGEVSTADALQVSGGAFATDVITDNQFAGGGLDSGSAINVLGDVINASTMVISGNHCIDGFTNMVNFAGAPTVSLGPNNPGSCTNPYSGGGAPIITPYYGPTLFPIAFSTKAGANGALDIDSTGNSAFMRATVNRAAKWRWGLGACAAADEFDIQSITASICAMTIASNGDITMIPTGTNGNIRLNTKGTGGLVLGSGGVSTHINSTIINDDMKGQLSIANPATSATKTFTVGAYAVAPSCTIAPNQNMGAVTWWKNSSNTNLIITISSNPGATFTFDYTCFGNPN